jgi:hypothetical protein
MELQSLATQLEAYVNDTLSKRGPQELSLSNRHEPSSYHLLGPQSRPDGVKATRETSETLQSETRTTARQDQSEESLLCFSN